MTKIAPSALVGLITFGVGCSPQCLDVATLPILPAGQLDDAVATKVQALKGDPNDHGVTNSFFLPPLFLPEALVKLNESNSILVAKRQAKYMSRLFEVSRTNVLRQLPHPAGSGSIEHLVVVSSAPLVLLAETLQPDGDRLRHGTWIYSATNDSRGKVADDVYGSAVSPDGRKAAWKKGVIGRRDVEIMDLHTGAVTHVFALCGDGSQVPNPTLVWIDSTNLVAYGKGQSLWTETLVYDSAAKKLWRVQ